MHSTEDGDPPGPNPAEHMANDRVDAWADNRPAPNGGDTASSSRDRFLPTGVVIDPTLNLERLWRDFEIFQALHHSMPIANPFRSDDLDRVVELLDPQSGDTLLDIATGSGELVRRVTRRTHAAAVGIDLSPWMIRTAATHPIQPPATTWIVADAAAVIGRDDRPELAASYDRVTCLGASWIWHGLGGTIAALSRLVSPGGRIAVGDMGLRPEIDPADAPPGYRNDEAPHIADLLARNGLRLIDSVTTSDAAWDDYLDQTARDAKAWQRAFGGPDAARYVAEQAEWVTDHARDRPWRTWTVWVAQTS